jgi:hypothetical protein
MPDLKVLAPSAWKTVSTKCKVQNNDLQKALAEYERLEEEEHDALLECIADIKAEALALKKSKEAAASKDLLKYVTDLLSAADSEQRDVSKQKADAAKENMTRQKAEAEAKKKDEEDEDSEEEEEEGEYQDKLLAALKKLKGAKQLTYQFIVCDGKPPAVVIAKRITPKHKEEAAKVTGSKRFLHMGTCRFDGGHYVFDMEKTVSGLARKLQESLKHHTGKRHPIKVGDEAEGEGADEEGTSPLAPAGAAAVKGAPAAASGIGAAVAGAAEAVTRPFEISGSVGKGGRNLPQDVQAVQVALNKKAKAGLAVDGKSGPATIAAIMDFQKKIGMHTPDGRVDPGRGTARALASSGPLPPPPTPPQPVAPPKLGRAELAKAPTVWRNMQDIVEKNLEEVKKAVKGHYAHEHPDLVKQIHEGLQKLDGITEKLDQRIAETLAKAHAAKDEAVRKAELKNAKTILAGYIQYVKSEPLIAHVDKNPWVKIDLKKTLIDTITHMAQSIGT